MARYEFIKNCEIDNIEFQVGDVVDAETVVYNPYVMKETNSDVTVAVAPTTVISKKKTIEPTHEPAKAPASEAKSVDKMNKTELKEYADSLGLSYEEDATNADLKDIINAHTATANE